MADTKGGRLMGPCSRDEAAERVAASALTLALVDVEPEECRQLLLGEGNLLGLAAYERAVAAAHRRVLAWAIAEGYGDVVDGEIEGIASALGLDDGSCDWEQLFSVFPDPWYLEDYAGETSGRHAGQAAIAEAAPRPPAATRRRSTRSLLVVT